jgi:hypothetical protein
MHRAEHIGQKKPYNSIFQEYSSFFIFSFFSSLSSTSSQATPCLAPGNHRA